MRIVRPYGQSVTRAAGPGEPGPQRRLRLHQALHAVEGGPAERDIVAFAGTHDALVIAQWISTIDKIASKPRGTGKATHEQRALRQKLGDAAWARLVEAKLLTGPTGDDGDLAKLWRWKIHPYAKGSVEERLDKAGNRVPSPRGRWYERFAGDVVPSEIDAAAVARRIDEHLHMAEYRLRADRPNKSTGRIEGRARSIAGNVLRPRAGATAPPTWTEDDRATYERRAGDVAAAIKAAATARETGEDGAPTRRVGVDVAAKVLYRAWAALFDGQPPSFAEAKANAAHAGLAALHDAIRECYRRMLKRHGKDQRAHGKERRRRVSDLLPATMGALHAAVVAAGRNRDLAALVRLGKVIHYEASAGAGTAAAGDAPAHVLTHWPTDVGASRFWTSDGQAEIRRNEAFVRVWRHALVMALHALRDWADPKGRFGDDVVLADGKKKLTGELFDPERHARKLGVLLGARAGLFLDKRDHEFQRRTLRAALEGTAQLRHNAFHFNGLGGFVQALKATKVGLEDDLRAALVALWNKDVEARAERLRETMRAAHLDYFFGEERNHRLFEAVIGATSTEAAFDVPLPRFRRLLRRAATIQGENGIELRLPEPANRGELEASPARRAQYVGLKLVYERPFRQWLAGLDAKRLNRLIDRALARAGQAAKTMNASGDPDREAVITARAGTLGGLAEGETFQDFLSRLSAETASEMRVQRGYQSDAGRAKEQAAYIGNLQLDVLAQAFDRYLGRAAFLFLTRLSPETPMRGEALFNIGQLAHDKPEESAEDWQALLYFLLHLVPVDDVGRLLHQIRKWDLLAGKATGAAAPVSTRADVQRVKRALELYLDMHDAKFEGGAGLQAIAPFKLLFESEAAFDRLFPASGPVDDDGRLPRRGLREIMRFGHLPSLIEIFRRHPVRDAEVEAVLEAEDATRGTSPIAHAQAWREALHDRWSKSHNSLSGHDCKQYVRALAFVMQHRHSAAHVRLTNHVRVHRLMLAVLGRLVDFSGLWERDLYFVILALLHNEGLTPAEAFPSAGQKWLSRGQIGWARSEIRAPGVEAELARHFGPRTDERVQIRNDLAHLNVLNAARSSGRPPDLTACVNAARRLLVHDRKLKNAVAQSVIERLQRENLDLTWQIEANAGDHRLTNACAATRQATHLGSLKLPEIAPPQAAARTPFHFVRESLHGQRLVDMVAELFAGTSRAAPRDVSEIPLGRIDWQIVNRPRNAVPRRPNAPQGPARSTRKT